MSINQKVRTQTRRMNIDIFFESNFVGVNRLLILVYSNVVDNSKKYKATRYYLANGVKKNITSSSTEKTFMTNQLILI